MITLGNDEEKKKLAEETLATVWNAALDGSETPSEFASVRQEVDKILDSIKKNAGNRAGHIERKCIILSIRCFSCSGVIELLDYLGSTLFQEQFFTLSDELSSVYGEVIVISARLTLDSLFTALDNPAASKVPTSAIFTQGTHTLDQLSHGLNISISCSSAEGMHQTLNMLSEETTANSFNKISEELSKHVQDTISLNVIPDLQNLSGVFDIQASASFSYCSKDVLDSRRASQSQLIERAEDDEQKNMEPYQLPTSFEKLVSNLRWNKKVFKYLQGARTLSEKLRLAMQNEGRQVLMKKAKVMNETNPSYKEVKDFKFALHELLKQFKVIRDDMFDLQAQNHQRSEDCGKHIMQHTSTILQKNQEVRSFKLQSCELERNIVRCEIEASKQESLATEQDKAAKRPDDKAYSNKIFDVSHSGIMLDVGLLFAPFTAQNHQRIEDFGKHIMQYASTISQKKQGVDRLKLQSYELEKDIDKCKREAIKQDSLATEPDKAAKRPDDKAYSNKIFVSTSVIMLGVGLLFAPLTGGASAVVASAAAAVLEAGNLSNLIAAESHRCSAWSKRYDASKFRTKRDQLYQRLNNTETEIQNLEILKVKLTEEAEILGEMVPQLQAAIDFLNTKLTQIQDLEQALTEAELEGDGFNIIKNAFIRNPLKYEGKAQRCLENLQEKWRCVESGLCLETRYSLRD